MERNINDKRAFSPMAKGKTRGKKQAGAKAHLKKEDIEKQDEKIVEKKFEQLEEIMAPVEKAVEGSEILVAAMQQEKISEEEEEKKKQQEVEDRFRKCNHEFNVLEKIRIEEEKED